MPLLVHLYLVGSVKVHATLTKCFKDLPPRESFAGQKKCTTSFLHTITCYEDTFCIDCASVSCSSAHLCQSIWYDNNYSSCQYCLADCSLARHFDETNRARGAWRQTTECYCSSYSPLSQYHHHRS